MHFSIVMATNNSASTIRQALESIASQTWSDLELLVIDNASTDDTVKIVRSVMPGATIVSEPDAGIYDALNKGLRLARGDWIYVLGSDDQLASHDVLRTVASATDDQAALVYGNVLAVSTKGQRTIRMQPPSVYHQRRQTCPPIFHQAAFIRRCRLAELGSFPLSLKIHADHFLMTRAYLAAPAVYLDETICVYHSGGYSGLTLGNFVRSTREQIIINSFFDAPLLPLAVPFAKNLVRAVLNTFERAARS